MRRLLASAALSLSLIANPALSATVNLALPTGTVFMIQDGSGNNLGLGALCGAAVATLETNCAFQAIVNSLGQLAITGPVTVTNTNPNITPADAITTTTYNVGSPIIGGALLWNGSNYDRAREGTGIGVTAVSLPTAQVPLDPCALSAKTNLPIATNATALTQIIAASGSNRIYICSEDLTAAGATAFNLISGTGSNCATSTAAVEGSTTAANGQSWAANGGKVKGNGAGTVAVTAASQALCTLQSNAVFVSGNLTYVQAP